MILRTVLKGLDSSAILHPQDKSTMDTLRKIPGLKTAVEKTVVNIMEKYATIEYTADGINVNQQSLPAVYQQLIEACKILDIKKVPDCSTDWDYDVCTFTVGEQRPRIILQSGTVDLLNNDELSFMLGHELGHIKCGHKTYHMFTEAMYMPIANSDLSIWMSLVKMPLLNWYRVSDFSADRMGLLCCQDINVALNTMIKMSGLPKKCYDRIDIKSFIQQAVEFSEKYSGTMDSIIKYLSINAAARPWLVLRAGELYNWYHSGEYRKIINKYKFNK